MTADTPKFLRTVVLIHINIKYILNIIDVLKLLRWERKMPKKRTASYM
jgi:hypothetical protein